MYQTSIPSYNPAFIASAPPLESSKKMSVLSELVVCVALGVLSQIAAAATRFSQPELSQFFSLVPFALGVIFIFRQVIVNSLANSRGFSSCSNREGFSDREETLPPRSNFWHSARHRREGTIPAVRANPINPHTNFSSVQTAPRPVSPPLRPAPLNRNGEIHAVRANPVNPHSQIVDDRHLHAAPQKRF